jgi:hypothetical protein
MRMDELVTVMDTTRGESRMKPVELSRQGRDGIGENSFARRAKRTSHDLEEVRVGDNWHLGSITLRSHTLLDIWLETI